MTDVPSSAIIMVISTIIACVVVTVFITSYQKQGDMNKAADTQIARMDVSGNNDGYLKYVGSTIDGYKLVAVLKEFSESDIAITVDNQSGATAVYNYRVGNFYTYLAGIQEDQRSDFYNAPAGQKSVSQMIIDQTKPKWYINPFDTYYCEYTGSNGYDSIRFVRR